MATKTQYVANNLDCKRRNFVKEHEFEVISAPIIPLPLKVFLHASLLFLFRNHTKKNFETCELILSSRNS